MTSSSCAFCETEILHSVFAEDDKFYALYNIAPIVPGHVLVIPKQHVQQLSKLNDETYISFWLFAREITEFILQVFKTDAFDWTIQEMEAAGQTVPHLHLHIIPRVPDDFEEPGDWYPKLRDGRIVDHAHDVLDSKDRVRLSLDERSQIAGILREKLSDSGVLATPQAKALGIRVAGGSD